jgi:hypothetical protein
VKSNAADTLYLDTVGPTFTISKTDSSFTSSYNSVYFDWTSSDLYSDVADGTVTVSTGNTGYSSSGYSHTGQAANGTTTEWRFTTPTSDSPMTSSRVTAPTKSYTIEISGRDNVGNSATVKFNYYPRYFKGWAYNSGWSLTPSSQNGGTELGRDPDVAFRYYNPHISGSTVNVPIQLQMQKNDNDSGGAILRGSTTISWTPADYKPVRILSDSNASSAQWSILINESSISYYSKSNEKDLGDNRYRGTGFLNNSSGTWAGWWDMGGTGSTNFWYPFGTAGEKYDEDLSAPSRTGKVYFAMTLYGDRDGDELGYSKIATGACSVGVIYDRGESASLVKQQ